MRLLRRRIVCLLRGHQYERLNRSRTARIHASFCLRCYRSPKRRGPGRIYFSDAGRDW